MKTLEHDLDWNDRLQDWLDGELEIGERAQIESHLQSCSSCREKLRELEALDAALVEDSQRLELTDSFDERLFQRIDAESEARKLAARERVQAEIQAEMRALTRNWRRTLGAILPSVLAGIAIAFALAMYIDTTEWARAISAQGAGEIPGFDASFIHLLLTATIGAAIGYVVARWLSTAAE